MVMFMSKYRIWFNTLDACSKVTTISSGGPKIATRNGLNRSLHVGIFSCLIHYYCNCMSYDYKIKLFRFWFWFWFWFLIWFWFWFWSMTAATFTSALATELRVRPVWHTADGIRGASHARDVMVVLGFAVDLWQTRAVPNRTHGVVGDAAAESRVVAHASELVDGEIAVGSERTRSVDGLTFRRVGDENPFRTWSK